MKENLSTKQHASQWSSHYPRGEARYPQGRNKFGKEQLYPIPRTLICESVTVTFWAGRKFPEVLGTGLETESQLPARLQARLTRKPPTRQVPAKTHWRISSIECPTYCCLSHCIGARRNWNMRERALPPSVSP